MGELELLQDQLANLQTELAQAGQVKCHADTGYSKYSHGPLHKLEALGLKKCLDEKHALYDPIASAYATMYHTASADEERLGKQIEALEAKIKTLPTPAGAKVTGGADAEKRRRLAQRL